MKHLVVCTVPSIDISKEWTETIQTMLANVTWLVIGHHAHPKSIAGKLAIFPKHPSYEMDLISGSQCFRELSTFTERYAGGAGLVIIEKEMASSLIAHIKRDEPTKIAPVCRENAECFIGVWNDHSKFHKLQVVENQDQLQRVLLSLDTHETSRPREDFITGFIPDDDYLPGFSKLLTVA